MEDVPILTANVVIMTATRSPACCSSARCSTQHSSVEDVEDVEVVEAAVGGEGVAVELVDTKEQAGAADVGAVAGATGRAAGSAGVAGATRSDDVVRAVDTLVVSPGDTCTDIDQKDHQWNDGRLRRHISF